MTVKDDLVKAGVFINEANVLDSAINSVNLASVMTTTAIAALSTAALASLTTTDLPTLSTTQLGVLNAQLSTLTAISAALVTLNTTT